MKNELYAYRCNHCQKLHHPAYVVCQDCGARTFTEEVLEGNATLLSWTRVKSLPAGFEEDHRNFGIVRFENGVTVTGVLGFDDIQNGMEVVSTVDIIRQGEQGPVYGFVFHKIEA